MTLKQLLQNREATEKAMADLQGGLKAINDDIERLIVNQAGQARALSGKDTGTVNFVVDGVEVKQTVSKTVKWDQSELAFVFERIQEAGDNPDDYIKTSLSVSESDFKKWRPEIQAVFTKARSVLPGKPKYDFEVKV